MKLLCPSKLALEKNFICHISLDQERQKGGEKKTRKLEILLLRSETKLPSKLTPLEESKPFTDVRRYKNPKR